MSNVSFCATNEEYALANQCFSRAVKMGAIKEDPDLRTQRCMDLIATHANGCPLDFDKLLAFDDFNFQHDFWGIVSHIDRNTGKLKNNFLPRCHTQSEGNQSAIKYMLVKHSQNKRIYYFTGTMTGEVNDRGETYYLAQTGLMPGDAKIFANLGLAQQIALILNNRGIGGAEWKIEETEAVTNV